MHQQNKRYQFHNSYGSILCSFSDITTERTTDGRTTDRRPQPSHIWSLRRAAGNNLYSKQATFNIFKIHAVHENPKI